MSDELGPVELTEPVDVVAWLRALPVGAVLFDTNDDVWKLYRLDAGQGPYLAFRCTNDDYDYWLADAVDMATLVTCRPFRVLWAPGGGV